MRRIYGGVGSFPVLPVLPSASRPYRPHNRVAINKPGAPRRGGYICMLHASVCRTDTAAVRAEDVAYALGLISVRQFDPVGNLRKTGR